MNNYSFPKELGEKWIAALRSGQYKQYQGRLYNKETCGYCVLGVLGETMGIGDNILSQNTYLRHFTNNKAVNSFLTAPIHIEGEFTVEEYLTRQNDKKDNYWTFDQFANWLENNLELDD